MSTTRTHRPGGRRRAALAAAAVLAVTTAWLQPSASQAVPNAAATVIDDFEDGDASDWGFFGGSEAGVGAVPSPIAPTRGRPT